MLSWLAERSLSLLRTVIPSWRSTPTTGVFCWEHRDPTVGWDGYIGYTTVPSYDNGRVILWQRRNASGVMALDVETGEGECLSQHEQISVAVQSRTTSAVGSRRSTRKPARNFGIEITSTRGRRWRPTEKSWRVRFEAVAWYQDQLWVRSPYYVVRLDPAKGTWLRIAETSYGYGGMAFADDRLFQSGNLGQYGTDGATFVALNGNTSAPPEKMAPTLAGVEMLTPEPLRANRDSDSAATAFSARMSTGMAQMQGSPELASMATPLALGDKLCFSTMAGEIVLTDVDGKRLWNYLLGGNAGHSAPVAASGLLVAGCDDGNLYAFREVRGH